MDDRLTQGTLTIIGNADDSRVSIPSAGNPPFAKATSLIFQGYLALENADDQRGNADASALSAFPRGVL